MKRPFVLVWRLSLAIRQLLSPSYAGFPRELQVLWERGDSPTKSLFLKSTRFIHPADFLPNRVSFCGDPFETTPHAEFAKLYLRDRDQFDFTKTRYYELACRGRMSTPCQGVTAASLRSQRFIHLIDSIQRDENGIRGKIVLVECADGSYAVIDGKHRLAALMALGVESVDFSLAFDNEIYELYRPIMKKAWPSMAYRKNLRFIESIGAKNDDPDRVDELIAHIRAAKLETWAEIYHPLPFRELRALSTQVTPETPYRRLTMILERDASVRGARVLDLGCNLGFYSFSLARRGAYATGIEIRDDYHQVSIELARIYELPVTFIKDELRPDLIEALGAQEITLCFSTIQWVIAQRGFDYGMEILRAISKNSQVLYFDVAVNIGKECLQCPIGQEITYVERLLLENTQYTQVEYVGSVHPYRTDSRHVFRCQ